MNPYRALVELSRRENELVAAGRLEELAELSERRERLERSLPAVPPPEARADLEEAVRLAEERVRLLTAVLSRVRDELEHLGRGRSAVAAYGRA